MVLSALQSDLAWLAEGGVVTPDHTIRTKNWPLVLPHADAGKLDGFAHATGEAVGAFVGRYRDYFARHNKHAGGAKRNSIPCPASRRYRTWSCSVWAAPNAPPPSPPTSPRNGWRSSATPSASATSSRFPRPTCSTANIGRSSKPSSEHATSRRSPAESLPSPGAPAQSAAPQLRRSLPPERKLRCSTGISRPRSNRQRRSVDRRSRSHAT